LDISLAVQSSKYKTKSDYK